jgi:hypothetical protein
MLKIEQDLAAATRFGGSIAGAPKSIPIRFKTKGIEISALRDFNAILSSTFGPSA